MRDGCSSIQLRSIKVIQLGLSCTLNAVRALQVLETTSECGFDSFRAHHLSITSSVCSAFLHLPQAQTIGRKFLMPSSKSNYCLVIRRSPVRSKAFHLVTTTTYSVPGLVANSRTPGSTVLVATGWPPDDSWAAAPLSLILQTLPSRDLILATRN